MRTLTSFGIIRKFASNKFSAVHISLRAVFIMSKIIVVCIAYFLISADSVFSCELPRPLTYKIIDTESYSEIIKDQKVINGFGRYSKLIVDGQYIPVLCNTILQLAIGTYDSEVRITNCDLREIEGGHYEFCGTLHYLEIAFNTIRTLRNYTFSDMKVRNLNLSYNGIEWIEPSTFDDNQFLETITLRGNKLKIIHSGWFRNATMLYKIDLGENSLWTLQNTAFKYLINNTFMCFVLDHNKISRLHDHFLKGFRFVSVLNLNGNKITSLPSAFLKNLLAYEVQLKDNRLKTLPLIFFQKYPNIFYLDLRKNKFSCKYMSAIKNYAAYKRRTVFCSWEQCYSIQLGKKYSNFEVDGVY